ncbi:hypothetical protein CH306_26335 [Rhodococcus sp. 15-725-2-2b]|nr:hypothetical protein CH306_26335 [Rhodococcus sp. 15-725-2-2b]
MAVGCTPHTDATHTDFVLIGTTVACTCGLVYEWERIGRDVALLDVRVVIEPDGRERRRFQHTAPVAMAYR